MNVTFGTSSRIPLLSLLLPLACAPFLSAQIARPSASEGISVTNVDRTDTARLADGGVVSVEGAGGFVVTLAGELRGRADKDGVIGVLFVPEVAFFANLSRGRKIMLSAAEFTVPVAAGSSSYFVSPSKHAAAGFPAYHLYLFNTTGAAATVNVYVYPTRN
jgi:hypothetical protein